MCCPKLILSKISKNAKRIAFVVVRDQIVNRSEPPKMFDIAEAAAAGK